jgi:hypothetical protein
LDDEFEAEADVETWSRLAEALIKNHGGLARKKRMINIDIDFEDPAVWVMFATVVIVFLITLGVADNMHEQAIEAGLHSQECETKAETKPTPSEVKPSSFMKAVLDDCYKTGGTFDECQSIGRASVGR